MSKKKQKQNNTSKVFTKDNIINALTIVTLFAIFVTSITNNVNKVEPSKELSKAEIQEANELDFITKLEEVLDGKEESIPTEESEEDMETIAFLNKISDNLNYLSSIEDDKSLSYALNKTFEPAAVSNEGLMSNAMKKLKRLQKKYSKKTENKSYTVYKVFSEFEVSRTTYYDEYKKLIKDYKLNKFDYYGLRFEVRKLKVTDDVTKLYQKVFSRKPDKSGLDFWVKNILNYKYSLEEVEKHMIYDRDNNNKK